MNPVLVINDDRDLFFTMKTYLKEMEVDFVAASTADGALALARKHDFVLALIDLKLVDMDGDKLYDKLIELEAHYTLPVGVLLNTKDKEELEVINRWAPELPVTLLSVPLNKDVFVEFVSSHV